VISEYNEALVEKLKNRYRYSIILLKQLVKTDFKLRYQGSVLGYLWTLLRPLALFGILYVIFAVFIDTSGDIPKKVFAVYLLFGVVLWNYFVEVTSGAVGAIVGQGDIIRKLNFPKYTIILARSFSALINLLINLVVVAVFMVIADISITSNVLWLPFIIAQLFVFALALAFLLSALFVRVRDINYIWEVVLQGAFYATPILYSLSLVPERAAKIMLLNPVAQIIQDARYVLITPQTETISTLFQNHTIRLIPYSITVVTMVIAVMYFRKRSKYFAEEV
jgi:ABC-2 type transport system permease protein